MEIISIGIGIGISIALIVLFVAVPKIKKYREFKRANRRLCEQLSKDPRLAAFLSLICDKNPISVTDAIRIFLIDKETAERFIKESLKE
jgi:hypothetical protein